MSTSHPDRATLDRWLDGDRTELDAHIESCEVCSRVLDELEPEGVDLGPALTTATDPPAGMQRRVRSRLTARLDDRRDVELIASLFSVAGETTRILGEHPER
ncbi:MAG: hypothetical protein ACR2P0_13265 [Acidimicrobiales bacterium]